MSVGFNIKNIEDCKTIDAFLQRECEHQKPYEPSWSLEEMWVETGHHLDINDLKRWLDKIVVHWPYPKHILNKHPNEKYQFVQNACRDALKIAVNKTTIDEEKELLFKPTTDRFLRPNRALDRSNIRLEQNLEEYKKQFEQLSTKYKEQREENDQIRTELDKAVDENKSFTARINDQTKEITSLRDYNHYYLQRIRQLEQENSNLSQLNVFYQEQMYGNSPNHINCLFANECDEISDSSENESSLQSDSDWDRDDQFKQSIVNKYCRKPIVEITAVGFDKHGNVYCKTMQKITQNESTVSTQNYVVCVHINNSNSIAPKFSVEAADSVYTLDGDVRTAMCNFDVVIPSFRLSFSLPCTDIIMCYLDNLSTVDSVCSSIKCEDESQELAITCTDLVKYESVFDIFRKQRTILYTNTTSEFNFHQYSAKKNTIAFRNVETSMIHGINFFALLFTNSNGTSSLQSLDTQKHGLLLQLECPCSNINFNFPIRSCLQLNVMDEVDSVTISPNLFSSYRQEIIEAEKNKIKAKSIMETRVRTAKYQRSLLVIGYIGRDGAVYHLDIIYCVSEFVEHVHYIRGKRFAPTAMKAKSIMEACIRTDQNEKNKFKGRIGQAKKTMENRVITWTESRVCNDNDYITDLTKDQRGLLVSGYIGEIIYQQDIIYCVGEFVGHVPYIRGKRLVPDHPFLYAKLQMWRSHEFISRFNDKILERFPNDTALDYYVFNNTALQFVEGQIYEFRDKYGAEERILIVNSELHQKRVHHLLYLIIVPYTGDNSGKGGRNICHAFYSSMNVYEIIAKYNVKYGELPKSSRSMNSFKTRLLNIKNTPMPLTLAENINVAKLKFVTSKKKVKKQAKPKLTITMEKHHFIECCRQAIIQSNLCKDPMIALSINNNQYCLIRIAPIWLPSIEIHCGALSCTYDANDHRWDINCLHLDKTIISNMVRLCNPMCNNSSNKKHKMFLELKPLRIYDVKIMHKNGLAATGCSFCADFHKIVAKNRLLNKEIKKKNSQINELKHRIQKSENALKKKDKLIKKLTYFIKNKQNTMQK